MKKKLKIIVLSITLMLILIVLYKVHQADVRTEQYLYDAGYPIQ